MAVCVLECVCVRALFSRACDCVRAGVYLCVLRVFVCVRACACVRVRACKRASVRACVRA